MYKDLKENLLTRKITIKEFVDEIIKIDQSTEDRENCFSNLGFLSDSEIVDFIQNSYEETKTRFNQLLSLTEIHVAQNIALGEKKFEIEDVLKHLNKALEYELSGRAHTNNIAYKNATIAYFENDTEKLISYLQEYVKLEGEDDINSTILKNMLLGLQERGSPDYKTDYLKEYNKQQNT